MLDADHKDTGTAAKSAESLSLTEAEEAVAEAELRAEQARARAKKLRQQAQSDLSDVGGGADSGMNILRRMRSWRPQPPTPKAVGVGAAVALIIASLVGSGYLVRQHMSLEREHRHSAEAAAAARRGIELMLSIDPVRERDDIQTLIDNTTGSLQTQLRATSMMLVADAEKAKVTTKATVEDVAVESMTADSAVALVVARSDTTDADKSKRPPVYWRISVDLTRSDGQLKMSKVDFVQ